MVFQSIYGLAGKTKVFLVTGLAVCVRANKKHPDPVCQTVPAEDDDCVRKDSPVTKKQVQVFVQDCSPIYIIRVAKNIG